MLHHLGLATALVSEPVVRMDQLIRLTARLVARMIPPTPTDQLSAAEDEHAQGNSEAIRKLRTLISKAPQQWFCHGMPVGGVQ